MKNFVLYDDTYLGPGIFIINKKNDELIKFLKIFIMNDQGFPTYGFRAFSIYGKDDPNKDYNVIDFTFQDNDDDKNLYNAFNDLCMNLNGSQIETIDKFYQGGNYFSLKENNHIITLSVFKDIYGVKNATDFIDITIGDEMTCDSYLEVSIFYNKLLNFAVKQTKEEDIKKLVFKYMK